MKSNHTKLAARRVWSWTAILTAIVCLYPVENHFTRLASLAGLLVTWLGALLLCQRKTFARVVLLLLGVLPVLRLVHPPSKARDGGYPINTLLDDQLRKRLEIYEHNRMRTNGTASATGQSR